MDRIDLHLEVAPVPFDELSARRDAEPSAEIRRRVLRARAIQERRLAGERLAHCNAQMSMRMVRRWCELDAPCRPLMKTAIQRLGLSARGCGRILKVARTIADLARLARDPARAPFRGDPVPFVGPAAGVTLMGWETTEYFREKRNHPRVTLAHAVEALENAKRVELQDNGRLRVWGFVEELDRYVRVVLLPDKRTIHNAFIDRSYKRRHSS